MQAIRLAWTTHLCKQCWCQLVSVHDKNHGFDIILDGKPMEGFKEGCYMIKPTGKEDEFSSQIVYGLKVCNEFCKTSHVLKVRHMHKDLVVTGFSSV